MIETIKDMCREDALWFLGCAYDGPIPAELLEYARKLPPCEPPEEDEE